MISVELSKDDWWLVLDAINTASNEAAKDIFIWEGRSREERYKKEKETYDNLYKKVSNQISLR